MADLTSKFCVHFPDVVRVPYNSCKEVQNERLAEDKLQDGSRTVSGANFHDNPQDEDEEDFGFIKATN